MSGSPNYRENLDYLYGLQFFGIKLGLDNIRQLLSRAGNPQDHLRIIHIAGTNGKGSTAAALAAVFHAAGISAGLYTSPHLHDFSERIRVDTHQIDKGEIVTLIEELRPHAEDLQATFFEVATAMALLSFYRHGVEWAILETGMGGRLDATNVVTPELCLLTPVRLDHKAYLGSTLAEVAAEKAGIIKPGIPLISASQYPEVQGVIESQAAECSAVFMAEEKDYHFIARGRCFDFMMEGCELKNIEPLVQGQHQHQNLALAAAALAYLQRSGLAIDTETIKQGLESVCWPGRLELVADQILLDGAHNPAGAESLVNYLRQENLTNLHIIIGCKADKEAVDLLSPLLPFAKHLYVTSPPVDDAFDLDLMVQLALAGGVSAASYTLPEAALKAARLRRQEGELILVAGSLFLVAVIRELLLADTDQLKIII